MRESELINQDKLIFDVANFDINISLANDSQIFKKIAFFFKIDQCPEIIFG